MPLLDTPFLCCRCLGSCLHPDGEDCIWCEGEGYMPLRRIYFEIENSGLDGVAYFLTTINNNEGEDDE